MVELKPSKKLLSFLKIYFITVEERVWGIWNVQTHEENSRIFILKHKEWFIFKIHTALANVRSGTKIWIVTPSKVSKTKAWKGYILHL